MGLLGSLLMTCIAVILDEEGDSMLDDEPALKDLRVVLQRCDDPISRECLLRSLSENAKHLLLMHTVS